jgi:hypothetical protein
VAYVIGQHINRQTGEAFPGSDRIAARIAMSQATVIEMVRKLGTKGHLGVDPGSAGRGHANRYRMILKPQPAKVLAKPAKPQPAEIKPQPADMNHFNNNLSNHQERGFAARSADDVRESPAFDAETKRDSADAGRLERRAAFEKIKRAYPQSHVGDDDENSFAAFERALDAGNDVVDMVESAIDTACAAREGDEVPELVEFFLQKCWTETKDPPALNALR